MELSSYCACSRNSTCKTSKCACRESGELCSPVCLCKSDKCRNREEPKKNRVGDDAPLDERRKIGPAPESSGGQALVNVTIAPSKTDITVAPSKTEGSKGESIEFTKEEVDELLSEGFKGENEMEKLKIEKLKLCIRWFQEQSKLHTMDFSKQKCEGSREQKNRVVDDASSKKAEAAVESKEEELRSTISKLEMYIFSLKEQLESEKLMCQGLADHNNELQKFNIELIKRLQPPT